MKRFISLFSLFICIINICACSQKEDLTEESETKLIKEYDTNLESQTSDGYDEYEIYTQDLTEKSETKLITEYDTYSGTWTSNGYDENDIYTQEGGAILSIHVEKNHLEGTYVYVQDNSYRIASVENIDTEIIDSVAEFDFSDDGWGNSGKLTIIFGEQMSVKIDELVKDPDNTTGMVISQAILDRENSIEIEPTTDEEENEKSIEQQIMDRELYRVKSKYWDDVVEWDEDNGRYGMDRPLEPILCSDQREYTIEELKDCPEDILYIALNEIYARHGYIFKNEDLQNYFMGQVWYDPFIEGEKFNEEVFNDYEKENLKMLLEILNR